MNNRVLFVISLLAFGALAFCGDNGTTGEPIVPGPAAVIPFLGGLLINLRRRKK